MASLLASEFMLQDHEVKLVTQTPASDEKVFPFEVIRQPQAHHLFQLVRWCDVYLHNNISLKTIWPLLMLRKPWVVVHQTWISRLDRHLSWQDYLKHFLIQFATCISISQAIADHVAVPSVVISNPYRDDLFREIPTIARDKELIFVGRLVSDKGVDLLLEAVGLLKKLGLTPKLTVIGEGPELTALQQLAEDLAIHEQVSFVGVKTNLELVQFLSAHQIMVIPSRWAEPFGIVALEGIACGCVVVGSEAGGLKEAIGPCGVTFPNGDVQGLTQKLADLLSNSARLATYRARAVCHLSRHKKAAVAKAYLEVIEAATR